MLKLMLVLTPKDEPYRKGEFSSEFMRRVQGRAADYVALLGWLPGIRDQVFTWTGRQRAYYDQMNALFQQAKNAP